MTDIREHSTVALPLFFPARYNRVVCAASAGQCQPFGKGSEGCTQKMLDISVECSNKYKLMALWGLHR